MTARRNVLDSRACVRAFCIASVALTTVLVGLAASPSARAYVYFSAAARNSIARATLDGHRVELSFITGAAGPGGLAVDVQHIYWANAANGTIGRANIDGSDVQQAWISGLKEPTAVAVNSTYIYWSDRRGEEIGRAHLDGTSVEPSLITTSGYGRPWGVAATNANVYFSLPEAPYPYGSSIAIANAEGHEARLLLKINSGYGVPEGLAADGSHLYWAEHGERIGDSLLNGEAQNETYIASAAANSVAVDQSYIYWAAGRQIVTCQGSDEGSIGRATLGDAEFLPEFVMCAYKADGIAVDGLTPPPESSGGPSSGGPSSGGGQQGGNTTSGRSVPHCVVPSLKHLTLRRARRVLAAHHCALGRVRRLHKHGRHGRVIHQSVAPGRRIAAGSKVSVTLAV